MAIATTDYYYYTTEYDMSEPKLCFNKKDM